MSNEAKVEYSQKACKDVLSYLKGETDKEAFVASYIKNASKSVDYSELIGGLMRQDIKSIYNRDDAEARLGISGKELDALSLEQQLGAADKIVDAVYDVAYTRVPNNEVGGDGKPMSWERRRKDGLVAERALDTLGRIGEYGLGMPALRKAYFYPRTSFPNTYITGDAVVLDIIKGDANICRTGNKQRAQQAMMNQGAVQTGAKQ